MFTRIVTSQGKPEKVEEGVRSFREKVIPELKKQKGFKQAYFMVNRENGKYTAVSFWKNEQAAKDTAALASRLIPLVAQAIGATQPPTIEAYEVAVA